MENSDTEDGISGGNDEDEGAVNGSDPFVSTMSIHSMTLLDSDDFQPIDQIFEEVSSAGAIVQSDSSNSIEIRKIHLESLRARKALLEAEVESLKIRLENVENKLQEAPRRSRRAFSDTTLMSPSTNPCAPPATTTVASRQTILFPFSQPGPVGQSAASTPMLFSLNSRHPDNDGEEAPHAISSHSILVLSHPSFGVKGTPSNESIPTSDTGSDSTLTVVPNHTEMSHQGTTLSPSLPADGLRRHSSVDTDDPETRTRRVTQSIQEEIVNYWGNPRFPLYLHLRHSYPSIRESSGWIYEETEREALLAAFSDTSAASQPPPPETTPSSGAASTERLISSSTTFLPSTLPREEGGEDPTEYFLQPIPSLVWDYVQSDNTTVTPEHPFPTRIPGGPPGLVMAYINSLPDPIAMNSPQQRSQIGRRPGFTRPIPVPDSRDLGFRARLRSELFFNVIQVPFSEDLDMDDGGDDLSPDSSEDDLGQDGDNADVDDEDVDDVNVDDSSGDDEEEEGTVDGELSEIGSSSSDETLLPLDSSSSLELTFGDGDISNTSSATSFPSDPNVTSQYFRPDLLLPSTSTIGGKYEYFRETQRPRPFPGHKFVVSVFGTEARGHYNNRPLWVPTCADRLESILTQYLESHNEGTQTDPNDLRDTTVTKRQHDPLEMPQAQMGSMDKVVSWSADITQKPDTDSEDSVNSNLGGDFDTDMLTTRSCPGMSTLCDTGGDQVQVDLLEKTPYESEPISADVPASTVEGTGKKRRRKFKVFLGSWCCRPSKSDTESQVEYSKSQITGDKSKI